MATLRITIRTDNEAFSEDPAAEVGRILRKAADKIAEHGIDYFRQGWTPMDANGNSVGKVTYR